MGESPKWAKVTWGLRAFCKAHLRRCMAAFYAATHTRSLQVAGLRRSITSLLRSCPAAGGGRRAITWM